MAIEELIEDFEFLESWEDRYGHIIDLGRQLPLLDEKYKIDANKVRGCVSQVWLIPRVIETDPPAIDFLGDSDAQIVKGLVAILFMIYAGKTAPEILAVDIKSTFARLGLEQHLSPSRSNGFFAMVERIRTLAESVVAAAN